MQLSRCWSIGSALVLVAWAVADVVTDGRSAQATLALVLGAAGMTLPLLWRDQRPLVVAPVVALGLLTIYTVPDPPDAIWQLLSVVVAVYAAASGAALRPSLAASGAIAAAVSISIAVDPSDEISNIPPTAVIFVAIPFLAGRALSGRTAAAARAESAAATAAADERARIARELHDVVAHSLTVIAVQADAAGALMERDPVQAVQPLAVVQHSAREALTEMRHVLALLRIDGDAGELMPQPGLARVEALAEQARAAGLDVSVEGEPGTVPPGLDLAAFRIVQEALTNVVRHAQATRATVTISNDEKTLTVQVTDDGQGGTAPPGGHGLVGMRERVALYGGELRVGPGADGFDVRATFPLPR